MSKKKILVTGSTGNLGSQVCRTLIEAGYYIIGTAEPGQGRESSGEVEYHEVDLSDEAAVESFFVETRKKHEKIFGTVALAGGFGMSNISNTTQKDVLDQFHLNFLTAFNTARHSYNWMKENEGGKIIMVSAKPALDGGAAEVLPYALAKGSVAQLANILNETGEEDRIITSIIAPSIIDTPPNRDAMSDAIFDDWVTPEAIAKNILHLLSEAGDVIRKPVLRLYNNS